MGNGEGVEQMCRSLKDSLVRAAEKAIGRTSEGRVRQENDWWWNERLRDILKRKKLLFKE